MRQTDRKQGDREKDSFHSLALSPNGYKGYKSWAGPDGTQEPGLPQGLHVLRASATAFPSALGGRWAEVGQLGFKPAL